MTEGSGKGSERRKHHRSLIELPLQFYERGAAHSLTSARSVNISPGGLLAECVRIDGLSQGKLVDVHVGIPPDLSDETPEPFSCRVVRLERGDQSFCAVEVLGEPPSFLFAPELVGKHASVLEVKRELLNIADYDINVLIQGETGTGKNVLAELIHRYSRRSRFPFIRVNCPSIPASLVESELFGHEKGAFTDARTARPGLFRLANRGTLVLDEISAIPRSLQAKLLQAIEEKKFMPVGGSLAVEVQTRIISITNEDLRKMIRQRLFREDLYHRLNEAPIVLPALRDRKSDIPLLVDYFLRKFAAEFGKEYRPLDSTTLKLFQAYPWPGNVRELANCIQYGLLTGSLRPPAEGSFATPAVEAESRPPDDEGEPPGETMRQAREKAVERAERQAIIHALEASKYNKSRAAARLEVSYRTLLRKMKRYRIER